MGGILPPDPPTTSANVVTIVVTNARKLNNVRTITPKFLPPHSSEGNFGRNCMVELRSTLQL